MNNRQPHQLDKLFKAALRSISMRQFEMRQQDLEAVPQPWRWPDPKTGREWTLMGRKGELLWHASEAHFVKNHSVALYAVQQAIKNKEQWHESLPGVPDLLLFWLGTMRYGISHTRTHDMISRALGGHEAGLGVPGDGGYLDKTIAIVEQEVAGGITPGRKRVIHENYASKWLRGCVLRGINPSAADWRPVANTSLPLMWPLETIERVFGLAHQTNTSQRSLLPTQMEGDALVDQLRRFPASPSMMKLLVSDAIYCLREKLPIGTLKVIEHYHIQGLDLDPVLIDRLSGYLDDDLKAKLPAIGSTLERSLMNDYTPMPAPARPTSRL